MHPLDPLAADEIVRVAGIVRAYKPSLDLAFNSIALNEPPKLAVQAYLAGKGPMPARQSQVVVLPKSEQPYLSEVLVDLDDGKVISWTDKAGVQPTITLEDLNATELVVRNDPMVREQCKILGITDMSKVYCDPWTIGYDERYGSNVRLQQALMYYRETPTDFQYAHPLDFCPIVDTERGKVIAIDVRKPQGSRSERTPVPMTPNNYLPEFIKSYRPNKPIQITQPEGVNFTMEGNKISWQGFSMHIGFNHREGIVLSDISLFNRPVFYRMSISEMVVPYGEPSRPHQRKHAFDVGEYGMGFMTNSLALGCDCKGSIHYLDAVMNTRKGTPLRVKNAVCIHEEDEGVLYKHTDFRDESHHVTRATKLVISQVFTAANYEYMVYWNFHQDGTIQPELKLTGILNTYCVADDEEPSKYGTIVNPGVIAHNHQHIFNIRIDPCIDGSNNNTVIQSDAVSGEEEVGSERNYYGNAFYARKTPLTKAGGYDYCHDTMRTWSIVNPSKLNKVSGKPVGFSVVCRENPRLMAKPGSLVWKRAGFARHSIWLTKYKDGQLYPAGMYVPQTSGEPNPQNETICDWTSAGESVEDTDVVFWLNMGLTHFPRPEDFPIMPAEPVSFLLRASHFFEKNPCLDVPPSSVLVDGTSTLALGRTENGTNGHHSNGNGCCKN